MICMARTRLPVSERVRRGLISSPRERPIARLFLRAGAPQPQGRPRVIAGSPPAPELSARARKKELASGSRPLYDPMEARLLT